MFSVVGGSIVSLPTLFGNFLAQVWVDKVSKAEYLVVFTRNFDSSSPLVRLHSECLTGDVFGSFRCDCGEQLELSLKMISKQGGMLIYLAGHEGRGIGLASKIEAYALQEKGYDTVTANEKLGLPVDSRKYGIAVEILKNFKVEKIRLLSNNPDKLQKVEAYGIAISEMVAVEIPARDQNQNYLYTKYKNMHHILSQFSNKDFFKE